MRPEREGAAEPGHLFGKVAEYYSQAGTVSSREGERDRVAVRIRRRRLRRTSRRGLRPHVPRRSSLYPGTSGKASIFFSPRRSRTNIGFAWLRRDHRRLLGGHRRTCHERHCRKRRSSLRTFDKMDTYNRTARGFVRCDVTPARQEPFWNMENHRDSRDGPLPGLNHPSVVRWNRSPSDLRHPGDVRRFQRLCTF